MTTRTFSHDVSVTQGSLLANILGEMELHTNSLHHQSVRLVASALRSVAFAKDNVVEGIEHPGKRFVVGVQWHPEWLQDQEPMRNLYLALINACNKES